MVTSSHPRSVLSREYGWLFSSDDNDQWWCLQYIYKYWHFFFQTNIRFSYNSSASLMKKFERKVSRWQQVIFLLKFIVSEFQWCFIDSVHRCEILIIVGKLSQWNSRLICLIRVLCGRFHFFFRLPQLWPLFINLVGK